MVGFFITLRKLLLLRGKPLPLINRVIEFRIRVRHFPSVHKEFKTFHIFRIFRLLFRQRRNFNRMIDNKCRLNQVFLYKFFKEKIQNIAFFMPVFKFDMMFFGSGSRLFQGMNRRKIHAAVLFYRVNHGNPGKRLSKIHFFSLINNFRRPQNLLRHIAVKILGQIHHPVIIGVSLIQFHQGKFRIMPGVKPFVTENPSDFINPFQPADNQPLQIQFQRNPEFQVLVQRIKMRLKRPGGSASGIGNQHRRFHFHKSLPVQIPADRAQNLRTLDKGIFDFRIYN